MTKEEGGRNKKLRRIESKLLMYFNMVADGCTGYVENCEYSPYKCGYSEGSGRDINTYELCLFATGIIRCPGEIEKHFLDKRKTSTYRTILRATESLDRKGYIQKTSKVGPAVNSDNKWLTTYRLIPPGKTA